MKYQKRTMRRMRPGTRKLAGLINELDSIITRSGNLLKEMERIEADSEALANHKCPAFPKPAQALVLDIED